MILLTLDETGDDVAVNSASIAQISRICPYSGPMVTVLTFIGDAADIRVRETPKEIVAMCREGEP